MWNWIKVYTNRRMLCILGLGFSSGLPLALTASTLQAWMKTEGVDLRTIGVFSLVGLPYTLKVLWAPLLDRFTLPWLGRRRGWILVSQVLLALSTIAISLTSPSASPWITAFLALLIAFFSASQDIVVDAYRADVLSERELGAGAAATSIGYRLAMLTSGAFALILSDFVSWHTIYTIMAGLVVMSIIFTFIAPEPTRQITPPRNLKEAVWEPLAEYFRREGAIAMLLFIILYKLSDVLAAALTTPFLMELGFEGKVIGSVNKAFGLYATIFGTFVGGSIISRFGINRSLWFFAFLQAGSNLAYTFLAMVGKSYVAMVCAVAVENTCGGMGSAAFTAFLMSLCNKRFTATQYALLTSLMAVTRVLAGAPSGFLAEAMGWPLYYTASVFGAIPAILLLNRFAPWGSDSGKVQCDAALPGKD